MQVKWIKLDLYLSWICDITALLMIVEMLGRMKRDKTKYGKASFERHAASRLFRCVNHNVWSEKSFWQNLRYSFFNILK